MGGESHGTSDREATGVTARVTSQAHLFRAALTRIPTGVVILDAADHVIFVNDTAEKLRGIEASALVGRHVLSCHPEGSWERVKRALGFLRTREGAAFRRMVDDQSRGMQWENTYVALRDGAGRYLGAMVVSADVTEKAKGVEEALAYTARLEEKLDEMRRDFEDTLMSSLVSLVTALEAKDRYTKGHSLRVWELARKISEHLYGIGRASGEVSMAAQLHDMGKVGVSDVVLNKPGELTDEERRHIQEHPVIGERIVASLRYLGFVAKIVRHHHERFDGKGYPDGLVGEAIPLAARVIAVADAYDAMTSSRPYREAMSSEKAALIIQEGAGTQFDPAVSRAFAELFRSGSVG